MLKTEYPKLPIVSSAFSLGDQPDSYYDKMAAWYRAVEDFIHDAVRDKDPQLSCTATAAYNKFREIVDEHAHYGSLSRNRSLMTAKASEYFRVLRSAKTRLKVKRNAKPNQAMVSDLYSFMIDINFSFPLTPYTEN